MDWNKCLFIGKVKTAPQISDNKGRKQAYMKFTLNNRAPGASGQWVDNPIDIEVFAMEKKADLLEKYIVVGQELTIECKYLNWPLDGGAVGHAFELLTVGFGFKPKGSSPAAAPVQSGPPL
jgi:hypothetical protein